MAHSVQARVRFIPSEDGGFLRAPESGIRPQLKLGGIQTTCIVESLHGEEVFELGASHDVLLTIVFWEEYSRLFQPNAPVELYNGGKLVATGEYISIT